MKEFGVWMGNLSIADRIEIINILACNGLELVTGIFDGQYKECKSLHAYPEGRDYQLLAGFLTPIGEVSARYGARLATSATQLEYIFNQEK